MGLSSFSICVITLGACPPAEANQVDQILHDHIAELAAIYQMLTILQSHPYQPISLGEAPGEDTEAWRVVSKSSTPQVNLRLTTGGFGSSIKPVEKFRMPLGKRDRMTA